MVVVALYSDPRACWLGTDTAMRRQPVVLARGTWRCSAVF